MKLLNLTLVVLFLLLSTIPGRTAHAAYPHPDLIPTRVISHFLNGQWFLEYTVKNIGTASAPPFHTAVQLDVDTNTETLTARVLSPGDSITHRLSMLDCWFTHIIFVDSRNQVVEWTPHNWIGEANNRVTFTNDPHYHCGFDTGNEVSDTSRN